MFLIVCIFGMQCVVKGYKRENLVIGKFSMTMHLPTLPSFEAVFNKLQYFTSETAYLLTSCGSL
jgi:hypothetical protein